METYKIIPIKVGEFLGIEKSLFTFNMNFGQKIVAPIVMFLVQGRDKLILVDTGCCDEEWCNKNHSPIKQREDEKPLNALKRQGISPEDIDVVINTHLHWDHCFNNEFFQKSPIYVQKKELEYAMNPLPCHYGFYESYQIGLNPPFLKGLSGLKIIEGDKNILPGIDAVVLPGHTPGFQGVLVNTDEGHQLICGDCIPLYENWQGYNKQKHIPSGIHYNLEDYYQTFAKIESIGMTIIPGHEPKLFD